MKKFFALCVMIFLVCNVAQASLIEENSKVAVMDFEPHKGTSEPSVELLNAEGAVSEYVIQRLVATNKFEVIDKDTKIEELKSLDTLGLVGPEDAKKIGEILGVDYIIYGNVVDVSVGHDAEAVVNVNTVKSHIVARIMDVKTGKIIMASKGEGKSASAFVSDAAEKVIKIGNVEVSQTSVHNALQKAAFQAVDILTERLFGAEKSKKKK